MLSQQTLHPRLIVVEDNFSVVQNGETEMIPPWTGRTISLPMPS